MSQFAHQTEYSPPPEEALDIAYLDEALLVVNKPSGLLSVPGRGEQKQDCLLIRVKKAFPEALIVHRLDMETSGLIVMARDQNTHRQLSRMFERREVNKTYVAVVDGCMEKESGIIDLPLICDWPNRPRQIVDYDLGKPSRTNYRVMKFDQPTNATRVELKPETGRTHQLRVHMQALGHPILGDALYCGVGGQDKSGRLLLHATALSFRHPQSNDVLNVTSSIPF